MAHDYVIISDATCNLPKQFYEDDFAIIPMDVIIDGKAYDADTISKKEFYDKMREGVFPSTSLINTTTAIDFFTPYLEKGQDVFFHLLFVKTFGLVQVGYGSRGRTYGKIPRQENLHN